MVTAWPKGLAGFSIRKGKGRPAQGSTAPSRAEIAQHLTRMGVEGVTIHVLRNAARYENDPTGTVSILLPQDEVLMERLLSHTTAAGLNTLLKSNLRENRSTK